MSTAHLALQGSPAGVPRDTVAEKPLSSFSRAAPLRLDDYLGVVHPVASPPVTRDNPSHERREEKPFYKAYWLWGLSRMEDFSALAALPATP